LTKLLLILAVALLVFYVLRNYSRGSRVPPPEPGRTGQPEDMVRCAHCSVNLPRSEAILSKGRFFCSEEHRRLGG
jgi:uncharacterized protein